jgi:hypothetical protein
LLLPYGASLLLKMAGTERKKGPLALFACEC